MCKCKIRRAVLCNLIVTDKFHLSGIFVIVEQICKKTCILCFHVDGKHCSKSKFSIIRQAYLLTVSLTGYVINYIYRDGISISRYTKVNITNCITCNTLSVNTPCDSITHIEYNSNIFSFDFTKNITWYNCGTIHIYGNCITVLHLIYFSTDYIPAFFTVFTLNKRFLDIIFSICSRFNIISDSR